jgi:threonine aldolase
VKSFKAYYQIGERQMNSAIDLRSDTLTKPTQAMRDIMAHAIVGDDVFGEDPTVNHLQSYTAELVGMEAALFVPSGTMGNQIAMLVHCRRGDEVIVGYGAHSFLYESGGGAVLAGVQFQILGTDGFFTPDALEQSIHGFDSSSHVAPTGLVMIENTHNRGGGKVMSPQHTKELVAVAHRNKIPVHIDGARLWNAAVASHVSPQAWGTTVDSLTFCLSKGLGAPVGSMLCGTKEFIQRAHRYRKMLGGGMRQAGILASAGLYALQHHVDDLAKDHRKAKSIAEAIHNNPKLSIDVSSVETNIVLFKSLHIKPQELCDLWSPWVKVLPFGTDQVRAVLHRDINEDDLQRLLKEIYQF